MATITGQLLGVRSDHDARILLAVDGSLVNVALGGRFSWHFETPRICVGRVADARHIPCPLRAQVSDGQCSVCNELEDPACVFEPRCAQDPDSCTCVSSFRDVPHIVYLAWYGTLPKIGMTQEPRFLRRLQEQGADGAAVLLAQHDGQPLTRGGARAAEKQI